MVFLLSYWLTFCYISVDNLSIKVKKVLKMVLKLAILDKRMLQNRKFSGTPPQTPLGGLQRPPDPQLLDSRFARNCSLALASLADARMKTAGSVKFPYFDPWLGHQSWRLRKFSKFFEKSFWLKSFQMGWTSLTSWTRLIRMTCLKSLIRMTCLTSLKSL